jgi:hypothetical protein
VILVADFSLFSEACAQGASLWIHPCNTLQSRCVLARSATSLLRSCLRPPRSHRQPLPSLWIASALPAVSAVSSRPLPLALPPRSSLAPAVISLPPPSSFSRRSHLATALLGSETSFSSQTLMHVAAFTLPHRGAMIYLEFSFAFLCSCENGLLSIPCVLILCSSQLQVVAVRSGGLSDASGPCKVKHSNFAKSLVP